MAIHIRRVECFHATIKDRPGEIYRWLADLAGQDVNLLGFSAVPMGLDSAQLTLFPEDGERLCRAAEKTGLTVTGRKNALLIQGDDHLGALVSIHRKLSDAKINVYASSGVADGRGGFGYVIYVRTEDFETAAQAIGV